MSIEESFRASERAEPDELNLRATLDDPQLAELDFEGIAARETAAPPETPAAPVEDEDEDFTYEELGPVAPATMWEALQRVGRPRLERLVDRTVEPVAKVVVFDLVGGPVERLDEPIIELLHLHRVLLSDVVDT